MEIELQQAVTASAEYAQDLFEQSASNFKDKPSFVISHQGNFKASVSTKNENYNRLNAGTKAHLIYPKPGGVLRFPVSFGPKTRPGSLHPMAGQRSNEFVFTRGPVFHPGTKPRRFDELVAEAVQPFLLKKVQEVLKRSF